MAAQDPGTAKDVSSLLTDIAASARFLVNANGGRTDVVLSWSSWKSFLTLLENLDDREAVRQWLPKLKAGPDASGALLWDDVASEWDDDEALSAAD